MTYATGGRARKEEEVAMWRFGEHQKQSEPACTHEAAVPRWDNMAEAGQKAAATHFYCPRCDRFIERRNEP